MYDICIIGAGIAGLTASIYARRAGMNVLLLEKNIYGGQMVESAEIENYPGIAKTTGPELAAAAWAQAESAGAVVEFDTIQKIEKKENSWLLHGGAVYEARAVIVANGATHRRLGCDGEERLSHRGVSYCATCDGAFFKGKPVCVVGGGNTALEDALFLSNMCEKVYLIHRRDEYRGDRVLADSIDSRPNIEPVLNSVVERITGENRVDGVVAKNKAGETRRLDVSAVFVAVGVTPDTAAFKDILPLDESGYIIADENGETGVEGLFAAGDCRSKRLRQIVTAAADGANAAFNASNYVNLKD